jgi:hypothetical protein
MPQHRAGAPQVFEFVGYPEEEFNPGLADQQCVHVWPSL